MAQTAATLTPQEESQALSKSDVVGIEAAAQNKIEEPEMSTPKLVECNVCTLIMRGFSTPVSENYSCQLGTMDEILSSPCDKHVDLVSQFLEDGGGGPQLQLKIDKPHGESALALVESDNAYPACLYFELVNEEGLSDGAHTNDPEDEGAVNQAVENSPRFVGRGKHLDKDWIQLDAVKNWYRMCIEGHGAACDCPSFAHHLEARPAKLIDTRAACLVSGSAGNRYMALSYVWGQVDVLKLTRDNAEILHSPGIFHDKDIAKRIPTTVINAIDFTRLLGERYLWVDCLCIVQDDKDDRKQEQLNDMTAIYANACLTIVAADGFNANYGLRGIRESLRPMKRELHQKQFPLEGGNVIRRMFSPRNKYDKKSGTGLYYQRAWTFQEYLFSKRRVIFERDSITWECGSTSWFEDVHCSDGAVFPGTPGLQIHQRQFAGPIPDPPSMMILVHTFSQKQLTYELDSLAAFAGMSSALSLSFDGGIFCGLPEMFFDVALLWQPSFVDLRKRQHFMVNGSVLLSSYIPSWSWAGWIGAIDTWSWDSGSDFLVSRTSTCETFPITKWQAVEAPSCTNESSLSTRRDIKQTWYEAKQRYRNPNSPLPEGWHRCRTDDRSFSPTSLPPPEGFGSHFYTRASNSAQKFWFPIPVRQAEARPTVRNSAVLLSSKVETAIFYSRGLFLQPHVPYVSLEDDEGNWAGVLRPHRRDDLAKDVGPKTQPLELIAISEGLVRNSVDEPVLLEEFQHEKRPTHGDFYRFYNVMWISRQGRYSYRRGLGRVRKEIWEQRKREKIEVLLA